MPAVSLGMDDKVELREIFSQNLPLEEENKKIAEFIYKLKDRQVVAKNYRGQRELDRIAPLYDTHDFWQSQPVPKANEQVSLDKYDKSIDVDKKVSDIQAEPLDIPEGFHWSIINIEDEE